MENTPLPTKKSYQTPTLSILGDVREVTRTTGGAKTKNDSILTGNAKTI